MSSKHIFYFDAIRATAILCVVLLHVTGHLGELMHYNLNTIFSASGIYETWATSAFKIGVDLFLMLSGALILGREWELKNHLKKRLSRIVKPFIFWALVTSLLLILSSYFIGSINFISDFQIISILKLVYDVLLFKAPGTATFWFFWMMLGIYLTMPILNKWLLNCEISEVEYFLGLWMITVIFEYSLMIDFPVKLAYFTSPYGLVVLGYYLRHTKRRIFNNKYVAALMVILPTLIMLGYSLSIVNSDILFSFHRYSFLVVIESIGVFCLFKNIDLNVGKIEKQIITSIATCSYGIYLIHNQIILAFRKIFHLNNFGFCEEYIILFIVGFIGSWIIIYILSKIPQIKDYVGV